MSIIKENVLEQAAEGELSALIQLDKAGFLLSNEESARQYVERIRTFQKNLSKMEAELTSNGVFKLEDLSFKQSQRIPASIFSEASDVCRRLFEFQIDWVPGFFMNPSFSFLFGGCAFCYYPDFFAVFIIRESFRKSGKWLFYRRMELLAHELCHIARIAHNSTLYEETFAYQTSTSSFRRLLGGIFLKQQDSFLFLASVFAFLGGQILRTFVFYQWPLWPFAALPIISVFWLSIRYWRMMRRYRQAKKKLESIVGDHAQAVLFRCSDDEIIQLASTQQPEEWLKKQNSLKWQVIKKRWR